MNFQRAGGKAQDAHFANTIAVTAGKYCRHGVRKLPPVLRFSGKFSVVIQVNYRPLLSPHILHSCHRSYKFGNLLSARTDSSAACLGLTRGPTFLVPLEIRGVNNLSPRVCSASRLFRTIRLRATTEDAFQGRKLSTSWDWSMPPDSDCLALGAEDLVRRFELRKFIVAYVEG